MPRKRRWRELAGAAVISAELVGLLLAEGLVPLRRAVEPKARRVLRNLAVAACSAIAVAALEQPIIECASRSVVRRRWGLLQQLRPSRVTETLLGVTLMDYTLYVWHVLTHKVPALWRLHRVHHADLDLDASTALRFHFAELLASIPWRLAQVVVLGVSPRVLALWQRALIVSILFHHSNLRLPRRFESLLSWVIVTPRLHGIHHSNVRSERDANWSSGLALWDRLHGTFRDDVRQEGIVIGVEGLSHSKQVELPRLLLLDI